MNARSRRETLALRRATRRNYGTVRGAKAYGISTPTLDLWAVLLGDDQGSAVLLSESERIQGLDED